MAAPIKVTRQRTGLGYNCWSFACDCGKVRWRMYWTAPGSAADAGRRHLQDAHR